MSLIWLMQLALDFLMLVAAVFWFFDRRAERAARTALETRFAEAQVRVQDFSQQLEDEALQYRKSAESHLRVLARICDEAARYSTKFQYPELNPNPTLEETELRAILKTPSQENKIPTLEQVEKTRRRLDTEVNFDLRTLLRDQLS